MIWLSAQSRQPQHIAWSNEHLLCEHALALGHVIKSSTAITYNSHLQSSVLLQTASPSVTPTINTFSFYIIYMCHHINPHSVVTYLSNICNNLEPYFLSVQMIQNNPLIVCSLTGMKN